METEQDRGEASVKHPAIKSVQSKPVDSLYLLTVEVQERSVPGSLSEAGVFQGRGEGAVPRAAGSSTALEGQHGLL